ncbi:mechanosensitive ion channel family protein [Halioxenophilus sp. WMMB6]|uniref:mechanosensitive ion channel family protein n=1 Tax=Halioxenophilus sp. WMMB6 TaxID=3073815 RepID=UPI00295EE76A|nr:mechanosensitive ion channel family protein [Halioxenophilus sp. WMMB6]
MMKALLRLFIVGLCLVTVSVVKAQETNEAEPGALEAQSIDAAPLPEEDKPGQELLGFLAKIRQLQTEIIALDDQFNSAEGDQQDAIALQRNEKFQLLLNELKEFNAKATNYIDSGENLSQLLQPYRKEILAAGVSLRSRIAAYTLRVENSSLDKTGLTAESLQKYKEDNDILDKAYSLLYSYIQLVEKLDFDPALSRNYLLENLPIRLTYLVGRIQLSADRKQAYEKVLGVKKDDIDTKNLLALIEDKLDHDTASLRGAVAIANKLELDTSSYQTALVRTTGQISTEVLNTQVLSALFEEWWLEAKHSVRANLMGVVFKAVVFILIIVAFKLLAILLRKLVKKSVQSSRVNISQLLSEVLVSWISRFVILIGLLVALSQLGISLGPLLAGLGVAGFIVGFALQDTLGNFASGMMILIYRPFDVGDVVEAGGAFGRVRSMTLVSTTILTFDNETLIIPNNKIWGDTIKNVTAQRVRRVDLVFGIGYSDDIEKAEAILQSIVDDHEKILPEPAPLIKLHTLGESSVDFIVRPWCKTEDYWDVYWDVTRAVKTRFDAEGVSIPFPQRDIHIYQNG